MKLFKGLMTAVAFFVGVSSLFAFKAISSNKSGKFSVTRYTWKGVITNPANCQSTLCTTTHSDNTPLCSVNGLYQIAGCTVPETSAIYKPVF